LEAVCIQIRMIERGHPVLRNIYSYEILIIVGLKNENVKVLIFIY
jgi:hypothetical protein